MNRLFQNIINLVVFSVVSSPIWGQVQVSQTIDSVQILIGEQTNLHLYVNLPKSQHAQLPIFKPSQFLTTGIEVLSWKDADTVMLDHNMMRLERIYRLTAFEKNVYPIPALKVKVGHQNYQGTPLALKVLTIPVDTLHPDKFYPPKDVQDNPLMESEVVGIFLCSLLVIGLSFLIAFLLIRLLQKRPIIVQVHTIQYVPAHEKALEQIDVIKQQHTASLFSPKDYYTQLTDVLRTYIEQRFGFRAMEMTSSEIIKKLQGVGDKQMISELHHLFMTADLVKFAKYETYMNEDDSNLVNAIRFVDDTKSLEHPRTERISTKLSYDDKKAYRQRLLTKILLGTSTVVTILILAFIIYRLIILFN